MVTPEGELRLAVVSVALMPQLAVAPAVRRPARPDRVLKYARTRDTIVVHTLGRPGRNRREASSRATVSLRGADCRSRDGVLG